jgi:UDP-3-O-[3-hydroxymyristoyl] glucosamine N-acyltransferase
MKLRELAASLHCPLEGDPDIDITSVAGLDEAQPGQLAFFSHARYRKALRNTRASAVILPLGEDAPHIARLRSANPHLAFARAVEILLPAVKYEPGIHPSAVVSASAEIGADAHIGPYCFIGENVRIGHNAVLHSFVCIYSGANIGDDFFAHSHVTIREQCTIGNRVLLQNGVVLGSDGFAFARDAAGPYKKISPSGTVVIGDDVEIQAQSTVDRPTTGKTVIECGVKIDSLAQVGHSCHIGENTVICAQAGLAGSVTIGKNCIIAGQVGVADHATVGEGSILSAHAGWHGDAPANSFLSGSPAVDNRLWRQTVASLNYLPDLLKKVRRLEAEIKELRAARKD